MSVISLQFLYIQCKMKKYNPKTNRLNEVHESLPLAARQFDRMINSVASWANGYTVKMEIDLTKDLLRLKDKWESKSLGK